jgi:serine/threonine protein kinase/predicted TPR repeat methyltransferase
VRVGPYELLGEIGRGGMGIVYKARSGQKDVAIKLLARVDAERLARFERERRLLGSLGEDQGFVGLLDAGYHDGMPWIAMPFVPGGTLRAKLEAGRLPVGETARILLELARALSAAHALGIVHRDLKPENILITAQGRPLVADLGLAKHFDRSAQGGSQSLSLSRHGGIRGTAGYMAPEQIADARSVGPPADIFALGAIGYECLTGKPAFTADSAIALMAEVVTGRFEPIDPAAGPAPLRAIIARALAADPRRRFADGAALARALAASKDPGETRRRPTLAIAGALVLILLGAAAFLVLRPSAPTSVHVSAPTPPPPSPPRSTTVAELLALAREKDKKGDMDGEMALVAKVLELDPKNPEGLYRRGIVKANRNDDQGALDDANRALELDPRLFEAWTLRAMTHAARGDFQAAEADFSKAIEADPGNTVPWNTRGAFYAQRGDFDRGIADFTRAVELQPGNVKAWTNRARTYSFKDDWPAALSDWSKVVALAPDDADAWRCRGIARGGLKDRAGAIADLTRSIELAPGVPSCFRLRGEAREDSGDRDGAIQDYERYLAMAPGDQEAPRIRARLAALRR